MMDTSFVNRLRIRPKKKKCTEIQDFYGSDKQHTNWIHIEKVYWTSDQSPKHPDCDKSKI
jgi:hypothetical protein